MKNWMFGAVLLGALAACKSQPSATDFDTSRREIEASSDCRCRCKREASRTSDDHDSWVARNWWWLWGPNSIIKKSK